MPLEDINSVSQIVASAAVVASLIYLAQQTRQTARNQKALMHDSRVQMISRDFERMMDPAFSPVIMRGMAGDETLTDAEVTQFQLFARMLLLQWEERFRQRREGLLDSERWQSDEKGIRIFLNSPGYAAVTELVKVNLDKEFAAWLQTVMNEPAGAPLGSFPAAWRTTAQAMRQASGA
jgi:hypothetical protein